MQKYEMLEKGRQGIKLTTNAVKPNGNTIKIFKLKDTNGVLSSIDISPSSPVINSIANNILKQYTFDAPNEDCYIVTIFNDFAQFFRVGAPPLRIFLFASMPGKTINYKLLSFAGTTASEGVMSDIGNGVYYITPAAIGDYIFLNDLTKPFPVHTPYVVDTVGMSGKIVFQKNDWMLLAVPKDNTKISDLVASIEAKYGVAGNTIFRVFNAYPSTASQSKEMLDFKPGVTPTNTKYNFSLIYSDIDLVTGNTVKEIAGFWCNTMNYSLPGKPNELVVYEWNS